jgi:hypothetical protein
MNMLFLKSHFGCRGAVLLLAFLIAASGCSKSPKIDLTPVAGKISLDGKPLSGARLVYYLHGSNVPGYSVSLGQTDTEGNYKLMCGAKPGAAPGAYKVTVSRIVTAAGVTVNLDEGMDLEQLAMQGAAKESIPERYSDLEKTELTTTVERERADGYDFQLTSN